MGWFRGWAAGPGVGLAAWPDEDVEAPWSWLAQLAYGACCGEEITGLPDLGGRFGG
ncbi:hypothetical protein [Actinosynnema mirum]|uniref:hypothetical protein n=1 Tax=Actinosynnema mirum TaxID=40567 RepID=UPI000306640C|nr:hypothetical protein [Actinosynnema mirum]